MGLLLDRSANVDKADRSGVTPLIIASALGDYDIARLLVEKGADVNAVAKIGSFSGESSLSVATREGYRDIVSLLLRAPENRESLLAGPSGVRRSITWSAATTCRR